MFFCLCTVWGAGSFGALVHGPTGHFFYGALDAKLPGTKPMTVATKVAIDQVRSSNNFVAVVAAVVVFHHCCFPAQLVRGLTLSGLVDFSLVNS